MYKKIVLLLFILSFFSVTFGGGLYNIYNESYTYGCNGNDNTNDRCKSGEITVENDRGGSSRAGSYRCGKIDKTPPSIIISGIKPEKEWVNIDNYNPLSDMKIVVKDEGSGVRKIVVTIGFKTVIWNFGYGNTKKSFTIKLSDFCKKAGCKVDNIKGILGEGKNNVVIIAKDAVYSYKNGNKAPKSSNIGKKETEIWVDNSKPTYSIPNLGDKPFSLEGLFGNNNYYENKWHNKTLTFYLNVFDKYGNSIKETTKYCKQNPDNSIWILPQGVNKVSGKFISYNGSPNIKDCKWECNNGYVKTKDGKCKKQEKQLSCKAYFEGKGYNLKNIDGKKLYFTLESGVVNKKTGVYTGIYDIDNGDYLPSLDNCRIKGGIGYVEYNTKNGSQKMDANYIVKITNKILLVMFDRGQKSCGSLGNLIDFNNGGGNNGGNGDIKANFQYYIKGTNGTQAYDGKDYNNNKLINDNGEFELYYEIVDANNVVHMDKNIEKVCGKKECVVHAKELDNTDCKCVAGYTPIDDTTDKIGRYSSCIAVPNDKCIKDSNDDGYYDTVISLKTNQIVKLVLNTYSTDKIPTCGKTCSTKALDTDEDGRLDKCQKVNGQCGTNKDACSKGEFKDVADTSSDYKWQCLGEEGGSTADCSKTKKYLARISDKIGGDSAGKYLTTNSYSGKKNKIVGWYKNYLDRLPEDEGVSYWFEHREESWDILDKSNPPDKFRTASKEICDKLGTSGIGEDCLNKLLCKTGDKYIKNTLYCLKQ